MLSELEPIATIAPPDTKHLLVCDPHAVTVAGVKAILNGHPELKFADSASTLSEALEILHENNIDVILVEKSFGWRVIEEFLACLSHDGAIPPAVVIWGASMSEAETMRFMHAGARGVLLKTTDVSSVVACLRTISRGRIWMDHCMLQPRGDARSAITVREQQVHDLVQNGLTNKQIALELGIKPGTVKIHMKHIFEKTGVRGRHALALASMFGEADVRSRTHAAVA